MSATPASPRRRSTWRSASAAVLALALTLTAAAGAAAAGGAPVSAAGIATAMSAPAALVPAVATVDLGDLEDDCPVDVPEEHADRVTCGYLTVPERRGEGADPERTLRLPVAVIASRAAEPAPDPLVVPTSGGPGGGTFSVLWYFLDHADWASADRDIVLVEQRGDLLAEPTLDCPELDPQHFVVDGASLTGDAADTRWAAQLQACHDRLVADGVDLAAYTSAESAADLADLRAALGYELWNLYGVSYGARLALTTMRDQPAGLRAVILDGVYPPNVDFYEEIPHGLVAAVDALVAACAADDDCHARYPDLRKELLDVLSHAAESPFSVTVTDAAGSRVRQEITDAGLTRGLFDALYDASLVRVLPFLVDRLAQGDEEAIAPLAQSQFDNQARLAEGLRMSIDCAEEVPFDDDAAIEAAHDADPLLAHYPVAHPRADCAIWHVPALGAVENEAVVSDIPTLLTSGGYDPVTPSAWAEAAATGLEKAYRYDFPPMGHGSVWANWDDACAASIAAQFLRAPQTEPDASCIADMAPTDFLTATDIHATGAFYRLDGTLRQPVSVGLAIALLVAMVATLGYGLLYALRPALRRDGDVPEGTVLPAVMAAGLNLAFAAGIAWIVTGTEPLVFAFGLPAAAWPLLLVPFVALAAAIVLAVVLVRAWRRDDGALRHRVILSVSCVACAGFAAMLWANGLLML